MQRPVSRTAVPPLKLYFFSMGYFKIASVGQAWEQALQPLRQGPSVGTMMGVHNARSPCSKVADFKIPVGQALMHSEQRMQLVRKSLSSRLIGGRKRVLLDLGVLMWGVPKLKWRIYFFWYIFFDEIFFSGNLSSIFLAKFSIILFKMSKSSLVAYPNLLIGSFITSGSPK